MMVYSNRVIIALTFLLYQPSFADGQVVLSLTENNVISHQEYNANIATGQLAVPALSGLLYAAWYSTTALEPVQMGAGSNLLFTNGTYNFSADNIRYQLVNIGGATPGSAGLAGTLAPEAPIAGSLQTIFTPESATANATYGAIMMKYRIPPASLSATGFISGTYTGVSLIHNQPNRGILGLVGYRYITPASIPISISVPAINKWVSTTTTFTRNYTNVSSFTTAADLDFNLTTFSVGHTEPAFIEIKAQGPVTFTPHGGGATTTVPVNIVQAQGTGFTTTPLSTNYALLNATGLPVPNGNITTVPLTVKISAANVVQYLFKAGTYTFNIDLRTRNSGSTVSDVKTIAFTITTDPLSSIAVQGTPDVNFSYGSLADYQTSKSVNMPNHLLITNNKNYEVYIKSGAANFTRNSIATSIPASIVQVENGTGETVVTGRTLSTTSQSIITNAGAIINRQLSLKYTIPASQTLQFLGKQTGTTPYILNVIYSFTSL
ncbi:hypothetical protein ACTJIJ_13085 [Niabella sp. 22666]|uniref:hypothetical protein n=1 Tax=Niabella sp. 22666 TaxID=3453954 RepID=UPI003F837531